MADLHILLNTITAPAVANNPASWIPICLPRFNSSGFLYAYIAHPQLDSNDAQLALSSTLFDVDQARAASASAHEHSHPQALPTTSVEDAIPKSFEDHSSPATSHSIASSAKSPLTRQEPGLALVCVSGGGGTDFETVRTWCENALTTLQTSGLMSSLVKSSNGNEYDVGMLGIPGLRHFVYKSRAHVQVTHPVWGERYALEADRRR